jgi:hypothetical protein
LSDPNTSDFAGLRGTDGPVDEPAVTPQDSTPVEAAPQEVQEQTASEVTPPSTDPVSSPAPTPAVDTDAAFQALFDDPDLTDEARNLLKKYQAEGRSPSFVVKEALKHGAASHWNENKRLSAEAKQPEPQPESPSAPAQPAAQTAPVVSSPDVAALDAEVGQLKQQFEPLYVEELKLVPFKDQTEGELRTLVAQIDRKARAAFLATEYEAKEKLNAEVLALYEQRDEKEALLQRVSARLGWISDRKERLELHNVFLQDKKARALAVAEDRAREAERQEQARKREAEEATRAEVSRRTAWNTAYLSALESVKKEGTELEPEDLPDFQDYAVTFFAKQPAAKQSDPAQVPGLLREAKKAYDVWVDRAHRKQSRVHSLKKEQDVAVSAPSGAAAVAPPVKRGQPANEADSFMGLSAS